MSNDIAALEERIASRIDLSSAQALPISMSAGGMAFSNMSQVFEFSKMMAIGGIAVRQHLRGNPGACLAVTIQAIEWRMSPFAVANKSYSVNNQLAYEAQLIHAVILMRAPLKGRPMFRFEGEGGARKCIVWGTLDDGTDQVVEYTSPAFDKITPKNSPLWKADPDQQHGYYSVRAFARRHFPDIILGVYAVDEISTPSDAPRDVTPPRPSIVQQMDHLSAPDAPETEKASEPEKPKRERRPRAATREDAGSDASVATSNAPGDVKTAETAVSAGEIGSTELRAVAEADVVDDDPFAEAAEEVAAEAPSADDEAERIFTRMENLDVAPRGIDQSDVEQCRLFLEGHDAAHAKHPRTVPPDLKRRWIEDKDERARTLGICWMKGHDSVTGFTPPPPASKA